MLLNTLAVIGVCYYERIEAKDVLKELKTFEGAARRFTETKIGDTIIVDDYAHHPKEVKATIKAARQKYPDKKVVAVFQPHTFTRTEEFYEKLAEALNTADYQYVLDIYPSREKQEDFPNVTSKLIIDLLENGDSINDNEVDKLYKYKDCVVLFMSPKEIQYIKEEYKKYLENN